MVSLLPLRLEGAALVRRGRTLVGPIDLDLPAGDVTAVIGPNGSGKTSLLRMMHGLQPARGRIRWSVPEAEARQRQAFVFQRPIVLRRSVAANLAYPLRLRGVPREEARARADEQARRFDLTTLLTQPAPSLSGGELQRLALARALITEPELLFADEPCAALDGRATRAVETHLARAASRTTLVLATHDMGQARRIATRVIFLLHGRVHETGPADAFFSDPQTEAARAFLRGDIVE
ncbi:ATP-binding cassette domain-containing protein [Jannaschia seohaensis]|uniref:Tungstate transport system ATP-binding protein n=1 Tax=Jannaschia seohaensis TaxID=475081 RepID=A0A2Y9A0P7_9RHOB|nr:ATP-binding cassette domain-containing protein [Jannaschia seohaensis]PWJ21742.1 tungstate transport system ATP-binding protein [Jannaschia seohaensis]SSA38020.1 tungstate transport system ATP-binding protein [Jannaschia seohaensis]